jgi:hypothetical protein
VTPPEDLAALASKYEEMLALRLAQDRARHEPSFSEHTPREALQTLAARFPGALREMDELPLDVIRARIDDLRAAARDPSRVAPWMNAQSVFHALARGALAAKRALQGRRAVTPDMVDALRARGGDGAAWADDLAAIARPPRGRLLDLVFARAGRSLGLGAEDVRALVFTSSRKTRAARSTGPSTPS